MFKVVQNQFSLVWDIEEISGVERIYFRTCENGNSIKLATIAGKEVSGALISDNKIDAAYHALGLNLIEAERFNEKVIELELMLKGLK